MLGNLTGWHLLIILAVVVLLFGATKLPALAKSVGQSAKIFKTEMKELNADDPKAETTAEATAAPSAVVAPQAATVPAAPVQPPTQQ